MDVRISFDEFNVKNTQKINDVEVVMVKGEPGVPTDEQVQTAVNAWLASHPESITATQYTDPLNDGNVIISIV